MKILRLTTLLDFGGQEKQYLSFTEKPKLLQHQYICAAIGFGGNAERTLRERGFEVHVLNRNFSIRNLTNIWAVYRLIKKVKPDVVHTAAAEANFFGIVAAKLAGVKTIIGEEIGIPNHSLLARKLFRCVYRFADRIICVSQSVKDYLVSIKEIPENRGKVIYNPVSTPINFPKSAPEHLFNIVYVGRLEKVKNVKMLIDTFSKLEKKNVQLTIVGTGSELEELKTLAEESEFKQRIVFTGFVKEPSRFLADADLFVLPSLSEGFGIAAVEAMLLKVPVLCSNVGGIPEFINDGENGWLFDPNNENEFLSKFNSILNLDNIQLQIVGEMGYQSVIDKFTVEKYIHNLETFYNEFR